MKRRLIALLLLAGGAGAAGWWWLGQDSATDAWQGYVDAEYVRVSPTLTGRIVSLAVSRGSQVAAGAKLFAQDDADDIAARDAAAGKLAEAEARLTNLQTASRETEIAQARADLADLVATRDRIARDLARNEELLKSGAASRQIVDQQRADIASATARAAAASAKLDQMQSPMGRQYEIAAQSAMVAQARAALAQADWQLDQRHVAAPAAALVADTFARPGETINAGVPVVSLLPPQNILVRFFVPETEVATMHVGDRLAIGCDGCATDLTAAITFIAPQPEYTPPVIYSESNRTKLVYLVEAHPSPEQAVQLKPGQPVDVRRAGRGTGR
ncbi:MAG TPA: HlyD family efflux transporter periplasmic adaptor subunit [Acetobacteraceae bacterium]|jgi:HlyD family secretion protein|nr:HlyD family efflux transporter periplasmic adaptor subunit [Acetobacteraceae bacterium]